MEKSIFSKIIDREIPAHIIAETDSLIVIQDIAPQAPIHFLIIPKVPFVDIQSMVEQDFDFATEMFKMAQHLSRTIVGAQEFKLVMNNGYAAGQRVFHAHVHFMAGF